MAVDEYGNNYLKDDVHFAVEIYEEVWGECERTSNLSPHDIPINTHVVFLTPKVPLRENVLCASGVGGVPYICPVNHTDAVGITLDYSITAPVHSLTVHSQMLGEGALFFICFIYGCFFFFFFYLLNLQILSPIHPLQRRRTVLRDSRSHRFNPRGKRSVPILLAGMGETRIRSLEIGCSAVDETGLGFVCFIVFNLREF